MCRLALMDNAGIRYMQESHGLVELFDYLEMQLGGHGNGICFINNDGSYSIKKGLFLTNQEIVDDIMSKIDDLKWIIYHTRLAGESPINDRNCHPFEHNGRVIAMNGNETDYTVVDDSLTDTENILITTPNIAERTKDYDSVFLGYENNKVFAYRNAYSLECIKCKNGGIAFASRFPISYHDTETVYEAPTHFTEGDSQDFEIAKTEISFTYGDEKVSHTFHNSLFGGVFTPAIETYSPEKSEDELIKDAMENPIGSVPLHELAKGKNKVVILADDTSRPTPSKRIIPHMLREIRRGNPNADISILVACGARNPINNEDLISKFGEDIVKNEKILIHDCNDESNLFHIRTLPSGNACRINKLAYDADLLVAEGTIEPHYTCGFSGGGECILPGIAARESIYRDHCNKFINNKAAKPGTTINNPFYNDTLFAAKSAKLAYIVNVVLNPSDKVVYAVAGDTEIAHGKACEFYSENYEANVKFQRDITIMTLDDAKPCKNIHNTINALASAEAMVRQGGLILLIAHDASHFSSAPDELENKVLARIQKKATILCVSEVNEQTLVNMRIIPGKNIEDAIEKAKYIVKREEPGVVIIPNGTSIIGRAYSSNSATQYTGCVKRK